MDDLHGIILYNKYNIFFIFSFCDCAAQNAGMGLNIYITCPLSQFPM